MLPVKTEGTWADVVLEARTQQAARTVDQFIGIVTVGDMDLLLPMCAGEWHSIAGSIKLKGFLTRHRKSWMPATSVVDLIGTTKYLSLGSFRVFICKRAICVDKAGYCIQQSMITTGSLVPRSWSLVADYIEGFMTWLHHHDVLTPFGETTMVRVQGGTFSYSRLELQDSTVFMNFCWYCCVLISIVWLWW